MGILNQMICTNSSYKCVYVQFGCLETVKFCDLIFNCLGSIGSAPGLTVFDSIFRSRMMQTAFTNFLYNLK